MPMLKYLAFSCINMNVNAYNEMEFETSDVKNFVSLADRNFLLVNIAVVLYASVYLSGALNETVPYSNLLRVGGILVLLPMPIVAQMIRQMRNEVGGELSSGNVSSFLYVTPTVFATPTFSLFFLVTSGVFMAVMFLIGHVLTAVFMSSIVLFYYIHNEYHMAKFIHSNVVNTD